MVASMPLVCLRAQVGSLRGMDVVEVGAGFGALAALILGSFSLRSYVPRTVCCICLEELHEDRKECDGLLLTPCDHWLNFPITDIQ